MCRCSEIKFFTRDKTSISFHITSCVTIHYLSACDISVVLTPVFI
nr:MAG TPA: hypothetical protein [Caudoviricetes sp.]